MSERLAPTTTPDTKFWWDALGEGKLLIQRCAACKTLRHPPPPDVPALQCARVDTIEASGRGTVYSFVNAADTRPGRGSTAPTTSR
jgi:uncharacterized OB-fold protein